MTTRTRRTLSYIAGLTFLLAVGLAPAPDAGAQAPDDGTYLPSDCPDCATHNERPGSGPGIYHVLHACNTATGVGVNTLFLGVPAKSGGPVRFQLVSHAPDGSIQANVDVTVQPGQQVPWRVSDLDRDGKVIISGRIGDRTKKPETFDCPCLTPDSTTSTTAPPPPSSTVPGSSTPPESSVPGTTPHTLPATGRDPAPYGLAALAAIAAGILAIYAARRFGAER